MRSMVRLGIRREDKNRWERRAPLTPEHVGSLIDNHSIGVSIESSKIRAFSDDEYEKVGAEVKEDLEDCDFIIGIKEIPPDYFEEGKSYSFFSHTIKGQEHNMPMLMSMIDKNCQLIDYEKIEDEEGNRLVFFGFHAGYAGMVDTLWALGERLALEGYDTPFSEIKRMIDYESLDGAKRHLEVVGEKIEREGLPDDLKPLIIGLAGYGHVSKKAQEMLDLLPTKEVSPDDIFDLSRKENTIYKAVFKEEDMVAPNPPGKEFELQEYYDHPLRYHSIFTRYLPYLTVVVNCIYWDKEYPRFITKENLRQLYENENDRLRVIGDISCDTEGGVEFNTHPTTPGDPVYVYEPLSERTVNGIEGEGPVVLAVDNLPCEIPRESSNYFSDILIEWIPPMVKADYRKDFEDIDLPPEVKGAVILHQGELTPEYEYIEEYLERVD